jgi:hypothetical protein
MEVEPVVSYTLIPPDDAGKNDEDGRVEPRLTVLPMERRQRSAEIIAPTSEDAALHGTRFEATPIDPLPPEPRARRRRGLPVFAFGLLVLVVAFGVLAATFGKVMTGGNVAAVAPVDEPASVALAPPLPATEETAGPGVRIIPPDGDTSAASLAPSPAAPIAAAPATETAALPPAPPPSAAPVDPPLPRLRPTNAGTAVASDAAPAATGTAVPGSSDSDVDTLMSDVDRILSQHRATSPEPAPLPPPTTTADAGTPLMVSPVPLETVAPPAPARRGWFLYPARNTGGLPVPPADIPDPEGAPGQ